MTREQYLTGHMPWEGDEDEKVHRCPVCGAIGPYKYFISDERGCVGCTECLWTSDYPWEV